MEDIQKRFEECEYALVVTGDTGATTKFHILHNYKEVGKVYVHTFSTFEGEVDGNVKLTELIDGTIYDIKFMNKWNKG